MKWLNELYYGTFFGGGKNGAIGYVFDFSGEDIDPAEVADVVALISNHRGKKFSRIWWKGTFPDTPWMERLAKTIYDLGWELAVTVSDATWRHWLTYASFLSVELHATSWAPFRCTELIYDVFTADQIDPLLARKADQLPPASLFARPVNGLSTADLFTFMEHSAHIWNVYTQAKPIKEPLSLKEESK